MGLTIELTDEQLDTLTIEIARRMELHQQEVPRRDSGIGADAYSIYALYERVRIEAWFYPQTEKIVLSGISMGHPEINRLIDKHVPFSISGSAVAVVSALKPTVNPNRNGWTFWRVTGTGETLQTLRAKGE